MDARFLLAGISLVLLVACNGTTSSRGSGLGGSRGGATGSGGATGAGGTARSGGATAAGGASSSGGTTDKGDAGGSGGVTGSGGRSTAADAAKSGVDTGSGGATSSGGAIASGGASTGKAGASGTGGFTGSGGRSTAVDAAKSGVDTGSGGATSSGGTGESGASGSADSRASTGVDGSIGATDAGVSYWKPAANTSFYWDLANAPPDNTKNVGAYDIDGWNNTAAEVTTLHGLGIKVVCYMDAGTYEPGRPDSNDFPASLRGNAVSGWPGEYWLDVRTSGPNYATLLSIMRARFQVCKDKGFDAVEPDNMDSYQNDPGFSTTAQDQLTYNEWVAQTVHGLGMAVFQKNDLAQIPTLVTYFDGILDEECNKYSECATLVPYTQALKPVWNAEYSEDGETTGGFCSRDTDAGIIGALFSINLDGSEFQPCTDDVGRNN